MTILFVPDAHFGDEDNDAVRLTIAIARHVKPKVVVQLGDLVDFSGISRFGTSPFAQLQTDIDRAYEWMQRIRDVTPNARRVVIEGNHEDRLAKWLVLNPAFRDMRALSLPSLLRMEECGFGNELHRTLMMAMRFVVTHGSAIRSDAGQSAKAEMLRSMSGGISGHTHRLSTFSYTPTNGVTLQWTEAGCLQRNPPTWKSETQNWQHGVVLGEEHEDTVSTTLIPFRNGSARIGAKRIVA